MQDGAVVIVGGTSGICLRLAAAYAGRGRPVVITGRDPERTSAVAAAVPGPGAVSACAVDLSTPHEIASCLAGVGPVDRLVIGAVDRVSTIASERGREDQRRSKCNDAPHSPPFGRTKHWIVSASIKR